MGSNASSQVARATSLIEPICDDFGCELVDVDFNNGVLKVIVDEPGGLNSQTLVDVTKAVSRMVDAEDPIGGRFTLEITSPGVERPLKKPAHFRRSVGETVLVKTMPDTLINGERRAEGELVSADEYGITLSIEGEEHAVTYGQIRSARTVYAWGPTPKKGGKANQDKSKSTKSNAAVSETAESSDGPAEGSDSNAEGGDGGAEQLNKTRKASLHE